MLEVLVVDHQRPGRHARQHERRGQELGVRHRLRLVAAEDAVDVGHGEAGGGQGSDRLGRAGRVRPRDADPPRVECPEPTGVEIVDEPPLVQHPDPVRDPGT